MQSYRRFALLAILAGSVYGSSDLQTPINRNVGEDFEAAVTTFFEVVEQCYISPPSSDDVYFKPNDESDEKYEVLIPSDLLGCRVRVLNLQESDSGIWSLNTVSDQGIRRSHHYNVTVNSAETNSPETTTTTTITTTEQPTEREPEVINLDELQIDTELGRTHRIEIAYNDFVQFRKCYIVTPDGVRIDLETLDMSGIEVITDWNVACGVKLTHIEEEHIGQWMLISRETRFSPDIYERRLPFTIKVTEVAHAFPEEINVAENNNMFVRLENAIPNPDTCRLLKPGGKPATNYVPDPRFKDNCGFIVREVSEADNGEWRIIFGDRITKVAFFQVTVHTNGGGENQNQLFIWTRDKPVQQILGSENATYCKITDPRNFVVFQGFGRCNITLPRATNDHEGSWKMFVGIRGRVMTEESVFTVQVEDGTPKAEVKTNVSVINPHLTLTCTVSTPHPIRACKFRGPSGRILMANPGVGEDRYTFHGEGSSYKSGVYTHDCGIQITDPIVQDLGFWRCAIETSEETYFGFLNAFAPWVSKDPEVVAGIMREPLLMADKPAISAIEGDSVLMSCSVQSAIRYCYFRSANGTVYNIGPGFSSSDMAQYAGAGLDSGECSIRFRSLNEHDGRDWSCHVGFPDHTMREQRDTFRVNVEELMQVRQVRDQIRVAVQGSRPLEYCRFVRIDGLGFTSDAAPLPYVVRSLLDEGRCDLWLIDSSSVLDRRPWTVIAKIKGHSQEITRTTIGHPPPPPPLLHPRFQTLWLVFLVSGILMIVMGALITPKKNRNWTYAKAASIRSSFRQRFAKKAVVQANVTANNTANAA